MNGLVVSLTGRLLPLIMVPEFLRHMFVTCLPGDSCILVPPNYPCNDGSQGVMQQIDLVGWDKMQWARGFTLLHWAAKHAHQLRLGLSDGQRAVPDKRLTQLLNQGQSGSL